MSSGDEDGGRDDDAGDDDDADDDDGDDVDVDDDDGERGAETCQSLVAGELAKAQGRRREPSCATAGGGRQAI